MAFMLEKTVSGNWLALGLTSYRAWQLTVRGSIWIERLIVFVCCFRVVFRVALAWGFSLGVPARENCQW